MSSDNKTVGLLPGSGPVTKTARFRRRLAATALSVKNPRASNTAEDPSVNTRGGSPALKNRSTEEPSLSAAASLSYNGKPVTRVLGGQSACGLAKTGENRARFMKGENWPSRSGS